MNISVVIPVFNEEKYIRKCLDSLINQSESPFEILVVNNNCTDKTIEIAQKYDVKVITEKQQGMIQARNAGFNQAKGDIIARCDADTILPHDWIAKIRHNFSTKNISALTGPLYLYDLSLFPSSIYSIVYAKILAHIQGHNTLMGPNMAITKKIWSEVKNKVCLDDRLVHEDIDLSLHIAPIGKIGYDSSLVVHASARRINHNPFSFFIEYPLRLGKTIKAHSIL